MKNLLIVLFIVISVSSCGDTASAVAEQSKEASPAKKLAVIDNIYDTADIKAIRIKVLLNELSATYTEPVDSIAEYTFRGQSVLHDKGISETCLGILEEMHKMNKMDNTPYRDAITFYLMIRSNQ
jgi:hypothetical protein